MVLYDNIWGPITFDDLAEEIMLHPYVKRELNRLKRLKSLGLVSFEFPTAAYSRWEHHLGMYHLSKYVDMSADTKRSLTLLTLLDGIGHLPYGYPVERAVLRATRHSDHVRAVLDGYMRTVTNAIGDYSPSSSPEVIKCDLSESDYKRLYRWFTAYKLANLPSDFRGVKYLPKLIFEVVTDTGPQRTCSLLSRIDYLHRDSQQTGVASFKLAQRTLEEFITQQRAHEWGVLNSLRNYLHVSVYQKATTVAREHMLTAAVCRLLINGSLALAPVLWTPVI